MARTTTSPLTVKVQRLRQYVGFPEVQVALGLSRSTIERMVRDGKFPKPEQLSPNRVGWPVEQITALLDERRKGLVARAVANPDDLKPEEVAPTMRELGARLLSDRLGEDVRPEHVSLHIERTATNDEVTNCRVEFLNQLEKLCGHFQHNRAMMITASIFPVVHKHLLENGDLGPFSDLKLLREYCSEIIDDETWAALEESHAKAKAKTAEAK